MCGPEPLVVFNSIVKDYTINVPVMLYLVSLSCVLLNRKRPASRLRFSDTPQPRSHSPIPVEGNLSVSSSQPSQRPWQKYALLAAIVIGASALYWRFGDALSLEALATKEVELKEYQQEHPLLVYGAAFGVYVAVTGLSLPGATAMTLLVGWYFKFVPGLILVSFASTTGATIAFLLSRYLFREGIQHKFGDKLKSFNAALDREGALYLFTLRLVPLVPFFVINVVMGLTRIRTWTFWWVSQLGMLAGTTVYVYAGSSVPDLKTLSEQGAKAVFSPAQLTQLTIAFVLLGLFPLAVKFVMKRLFPKTVAADKST